MFEQVNWHDFLLVVAFLVGWLADVILGDPQRLPHPIVGFGKIISVGEKELNQGAGRFWNGLALSMFLILMTLFISYMTLFVIGHFSKTALYILLAIGVFYCLAGRTLRSEVKAVFKAVNESTELGRKQLSRIVGRDTSTLTPQEIRTAALETLSENLSDGVIAPMFWYALMGLPGMLTYKMVNTLDSMVGYKNEQYKDFGKAAAKIDDILNYIPARITAFLMLAVSGQLNKFKFVAKFGKKHASPNAGYPEAALAGILNCRFGGTHEYFGQSVEKPFIGNIDKELTDEDMHKAISINQWVELVFGLIVCILIYFFH